MLVHTLLNDEMWNWIHHWSWTHFIKRSQQKTLFIKALNRQLTRCGFQSHLRWRFFHHNSLNFYKLTILRKCSLEISFSCMPPKGIGTFPSERYHGAFATILYGLCTFFYTLEYSSDWIVTNKFASSVTQRVKHSTSNWGIVGSSPTWAKDSFIGICPVLLVGYKEGV